MPTVRLLPVLALAVATSLRHAPAAPAAHGDADLAYEVSSAATDALWDAALDRRAAGGPSQVAFGDLASHTRRQLSHAPAS